MAISLTAPAASLGRTTVVVGASAAVGTTALAVAVHAAGVPLAAHGEIPVGAFAQFVFVGAILGGLLAAAANRYSEAPRRRFLQSAVALTALSCVPPIAFGDTPAAKMALVATHLVAAAIIVPVLARKITD